MKIDRALNIVIDLERDDGEVLHVHATPIPQVVFEKYFMTMSRAYAEIYRSGLGAISGPRVAAMMLKKIAIDTGEWEGPEGVERGLIGEMKRLTSVIALDTAGWTTIPFDIAVARGILDEQDLSEVLNALAFFTLISSISRRAELKVALVGMAHIWGARTVSSNSTEYAASLRTSTATDSSGGTAPPSSIPV